MIILLLLVVFCVVCKSIDNSIDATSISLLNTDISINERNLNLNTHHELAPLYDRGDPRVIRRKLTRSPSKPSKPTKTFKPSRRMKPTRRPTRRPTSEGTNSILPIGTIYQDAAGKVYVINTATQYTTYTTDGTCTTWPYYLYGNNFMIVNGTFSMTKTGAILVVTDISDNSNATYTIINKNPHASKCNVTKSKFETYRSIVDTFKQGDKYKSDYNSDTYM